MDKKVRNKVLYIAVGVLWAIAIYRTYQNYQLKVENEALQTQSFSSFTSPVLFNKDTFELILPNQDPFLRSGSYMKENSWNDNSSDGNNNTNNTVKATVEIIPVVVKKWPSIQYFGFVKNRDQDKTLCMLKIDGYNTKLSKGDTEKGVYISAVFLDSVHVVFEGEERTFLKK